MRLSWSRFVVGGVTWLSFRSGIQLLVLVTGVGALVVLSGSTGANQASVAGMGEKAGRKNNWASPVMDQRRANEVVK
jgi:hypothetical protein